jgi:hypothetical protein
MFSPLNFPADRLPDWLAAVHRVLPFQAMGEVVRGTLCVGHLPAGGHGVRAPWRVVRRLVPGDLPDPHATRVMLGRRSPS